MDDKVDKIQEIKQPLLHHLVELRSRLVKSLAIIFILFVVAYIFADTIYNFLVQPYADAVAGEEGRRLIFTALHETFFTYLKVSLFASIFIALPYILTQLWIFIAPGLYKREKTFVMPLLISSAILFYAGVAFAFFVVSPIILNFFIAAAPDSIQIMTDINKYLDFVLKLFFAFGFAFEIPVATFLLINTGITNKESLRKIRPYLIIAFFVLAMLLTPPDIFSQLFLAIPMWLLFEIGLLISRDPKD